MVNISEFERNKPTETYKIIMRKNKKYEKILSDLSPIMDDTDAALYKAYSDALEDVKEIKKYFLSGK